ncbi:MAG: HAMP domain-containing sensor histidine kinase [bacterium]|nr:HAMP domain-containing sensor histidine kinase [bacterium]
MEKDAILRQTITSLSHDIRTPLTSMDGYLQLLELEQEPEQQEKYIEIIKGRTKILKEILEELFLYTKLQDQGYQLELQKENMTQIVFEGVTAFYEEFKQSKIEPDILFSEEALEVECNKSMMQRIVQNIVKNSIVHGVSLVRISFRKEEGQAVLRCENDIKEEDSINMELIFERFYKADVSRSKSSSGLGLAITKELVEKMNGTIEAEKQENMFEIVIKFDLW